VNIKKISNSDKLFLISIFLIGLFVRVAFIDQPMRYDESFTYLNYVENFKKLFLYSAPNNHVLHTLLTKLNTILFGNEPQVIRLTALIFGLILIPISFFISKKQEFSGYFVALIYATFPYLILYSTYARGYTILVFSTLIMIYLGDKIIAEAKKRLIISLSLVSSIGLYAIPLMILPIFGIYLWISSYLILCKGNIKQYLINFLFPSIGLIVFFSTIAYLPVFFSTGIVSFFPVETLKEKSIYEVISGLNIFDYLDIVLEGLRSIQTNSLTLSTSSEVFFKELSTHFQHVTNDLLSFIPVFVQIIISSLFLIGVFSLIKEQNWKLVSLFAIMFFGALFIIFLKQNVPVTRAWIFILPIIFLICDKGFTYLIFLLNWKFRIFIKFMLIILAVIFVLNLVQTNAIIKYNESNEFIEAEEVSLFLKEIISPNDLIHVRVPADAPLFFYLKKNNVNFFPWYGDLKELPKEGKLKKMKQYFVVKKNWQKITDFTNKPVSRIFDKDGVAIYIKN